MGIKPTSMLLNDEDKARLLVVCERLAVTRSRAIAIGINFLHAMMNKEIPSVDLVGDEVSKQMEQVLRLDGVIRRARKFSTPPPISAAVMGVPVQVPAVRKKRGWPKGKKRGPRKAKILPMLRVVK